MDLYVIERCWGLTSTWNIVDEAWFHDAVTKEDYPGKMRSRSMEACIRLLRVFLLPFHPAIKLRLRHVTTRNVLPWELM